MKHYIKKGVAQSNKNNLFGGKNKIKSGLCINTLGYCKNEENWFLKLNIFRKHLNTSG